MTFSDPWEKKKGAMGRVGSGVPVQPCGLSVRYLTQNPKHDQKISEGIPDLYVGISKRARPQVRNPESGAWDRDPRAPPPLGFRD